MPSDCQRVGFCKSATARLLILMLRMPEERCDTAKLQAKADSSPIRHRGVIRHRIPPWSNSPYMSALECLSLCADGVSDPFGVVDGAGPFVGPEMEGMADSENHPGSTAGPVHALFRVVFPCPPWSTVWTAGHRRLGGPAGAFHSGGCDNRD